MLISWINGRVVRPDDDRTRCSTFETSRDARQGRGEAVAKLKFILDCHLFAADFDYLLKIRIGDIADFKRIHGDQLIALPGIRQSRTFFVMKEVVDNAPLKFGAPEEIRAPDPGFTRAYPLRARRC